MRKLRLKELGLLILVAVILSGCLDASAAKLVDKAPPIVTTEDSNAVQVSKEPADPPPTPTQPTEVEVAVSAPHVTTSWDERKSAPEKFDLPLLYLHRERQATPAETAPWNSRSQDYRRTLPSRSRQCHGTRTSPPASGALEPSSLCPNDPARQRRRARSRGSSTPAPPTVISMICA